MTTTHQYWVRRRKQKQQIFLTELSFSWFSRSYGCSTSIRATSWRALPVFLRASTEPEHHYRHECIQEPPPCVVRMSFGKYIHQTIKPNLDSSVLIASSSIFCRVRYIARAWSFSELTKYTWSSSSCSFTRLLSTDFNLNRKKLKYSTS